ncbi:hypothetical protein IFR05_004847 [Cadophora sp. M221]|nr:hypothetical protein IFR05_004847 [Cadophora sp. M221]
MPSSITAAETITISLSKLVDGIGLRRVQGDNWAASVDQADIEGALAQVETEASQVATTRLSYNTGHGDFCFGSRSGQQLLDAKNATTQAEILWHTGVEGSAGASVAELDGFRRSGPFPSPFMRLPLEIRRKVYRLLLGSFYSYDRTTKQSSINLFFEQQSPVFDLDIGGGLISGLGLKALDLFLDTTQFGAHGAHKFKKWCARVLGLLQLETFRLLVIVNNSCLPDLLHRRAQFSTLSECRSLNVSKSFSLSLEIDGLDDTDTEYFFYDYQAKCGKNEKSMIKLKDLMIPDTLRAPPTRMDKCISSHHPDPTRLNS